MMAHYDLAVAGGGLGGLAAAALASVGGRRVVLFDSGGSGDSSGIRSVDGFTFSTLPPLTYELQPGGAVLNVLARLGAKQITNKPATRYQVALSDRRITVSSVIEETIDELAREFPQDVPSVKKFYRDLKNKEVLIAKSGIAAFLARRTSAAAFMRRYRFSPRLKFAFEVQSRYFFHSTLSRLSLTSLIALCNSMPAERYGGAGGLGGIFIEALRRSGGDVRNGALPVKISYNRGRSIGLNAGPEFVEAKTVLLIEPCNSPQTAFLGISDNVVPVGMAGHVLYVPEYERPENIFSLALSPEGDGAFAPLHAKALSVSIRCERRLDPQEITSTLAGIIPFLGDNIRFMETPLPPKQVWALQDDVPFKPVRSSAGDSLLFRGPKRLYRLKDAPDMTGALLTVVRNFIERMV
jgi:hypothetical protein